MAKKLKSILITNLEEPSNEDVVEIINKIIEDGYSGTGSKAFIYATRGYFRQLEEIGRLRKKLFEIESELRSYKENAGKAQEILRFFADS